MDIVDYKGNSNEHRSHAAFNRAAYYFVAFRYQKLRNVGTDLGGAIRGFKKSMNDDDDGQKDKTDSLEKGEESKAYSASAEKSDEKTHS